MKKFLLGIFCLALTVSACQKTDDLWEEVGSLKMRVAQLESEVGKINSSISALYALVQESTLVVGCRQTDTGYVLELSDGTSVSVLLGDRVEALVPILGVDAEGLWIYSLDNGETFQPLLDGKGEPVSARPASDDGTSPRLRVDAEGYWEVSYDGGASWEKLLAGGEPVNAVGGSSTISYSSFFDTLTYDEKSGKVEIGLRNGDKLTLTVFDTFSLKVEDADGARFALGETKCFAVEQRGVAGAFIQAPDGWTVVLNEETLLVSAPARNRTEREVEVRIVVTSEENYIKMVTLNFVQLTVGIDENGCEAWNNFKLQNEENVLLDYSYAGYKHGEQAPPQVEGLGYKVYNVVDYGADPTGATSSREALVKLLTELKLTGKNSNGNNQANANARAIIYFPEGTFVLHNDDDNSKDTSSANQTELDSKGNNKSEEISIRGGNFVLKGAGRGKTVLLMDTPNLPTNPSNMWTSPVMINIKHNSGLSDLTDVTADAARGTFSVEVGSTADISAGDWVCLYLACKDAECVAEELAPHQVEGSMTDIQTVTVEDLHQVASVSGSTVTFVEPIMHVVKAKYGWKIRKFPHYENVGVEDLTFAGHSKENFGHHASWQDDGAYKPLQLMRVTDSWIRRVDFRNVSEAASIVSGANCSAYDIEISGNRGHSGVRSQSSSRIFIGKVWDHSSGVATSRPTVGMGYIENAGQYHASGVSNTSLGAVLWNNTWGDDAFFESHSKQPRATLVDRCRGGFVQWRFGGDETNVPNHLSDLTIWNLDATQAAHDFGASPFKWWLSADKWWKTMPPIIVGLHGAAVTFDESPEQIKYLESNGEAVQPESLYEAQLRRRLGYVPAWLNALK